MIKKKKKSSKKKLNIKENDNGDDHLDQRTGTGGRGKHFVLSNER